jgi:hypothetical protein
MEDYYLISVESRKGGVGKTTAALNLGYLLKERMHVLLLDLDITGTSINAIRDSRFWKDDTILLSLNEKPINLLKYFSDSYLKGKDMFEFSRTDEDQKVCVQENVINVFASELYGDDARELYNPSLLLDTLHVFWLTKMIGIICERFSTCFKDGRRCAIILDNSPGYVGIGKAVHDLMTDMGPERAKVLTVSSLDIQDFQSSLKSVYSLHEEYLDKLNGSRFPETNKGLESFYAQVRLSGDTEYQYYKSEPDEASISSYQGVIINKVERSIIEGRKHYDYHQSLNPCLLKVFDSLFDNHIEDYLVPFDNVLLTQFYGVFEDTVDTSKTNRSTLNIRLGAIEGQIKRLENDEFDLSPYSLLRRAEGFDKSLDALKGALIACGYEVIASKFIIDWSPLEPLRKIIRFLKGVGYTSESFEFYVPRQKRMEREMQSFGSISVERFPEEGSGYRDIFRFISAVGAVASTFSLCYSSLTSINNSKEWKNDDKVGDVKATWIKHVNLVLSEWMKDIGVSFIENYIGKKSLASFILSEDARKWDKALYGLFDSDEFVALFKGVISRLIDMVSDMRTLTHLIKTVTINNEGSFSLDVDFAPLLNQKIIEKKIDYSEANIRMYSELRDSDYMMAYRDVLKRVLGNWNV